MNRVLCRVYSYRRCVERTLRKIARYTRRRGGTAAACWPVFPSPLKSEISRSIDDHLQLDSTRLHLLRPAFPFQYTKSSHTRAQPWHTHQSERSKENVKANWNWSIRGDGRFLRASPVILRDSVFVINEFVKRGYAHRYSNDRGTTLQWSCNAINTIPLTVETFIVHQLFYLLSTRRIGRFDNYRCIFCCWISFHAREISNIDRSIYNQISSNIILQIPSLNFIRRSKAKTFRFRSFSIIQRFSYYFSTWNTILVAIFEK